MIGEKVEYEYINPNTDRPVTDIGMIVDKILVNDSDHYLIKTANNVKSIRCDKIKRLITS
jgi:hypothetical protein